MLSSALFTATRWRLVFWNIAVTGVIIAIFALVAYFTAAHVLSGEIDQQLAARAAQVQGHIGPNLSFGFNSDHDYDVNSPGIFILLLSPNGTVLYSSVRYPTAKAGGLWPDSTAIRHTFSGVPLWLHCPSHQGHLTTAPLPSSLAG